MKFRLWTPDGPEVMRGLFVWAMTFEQDANTFWGDDARAEYQRKTGFISELPLEVDE